MIKTDIKTKTIAEAKKDLAIFTTKANRRITRLKKSIAILKKESVLFMRYNVTIQFKIIKKLFAITYIVQTLIDDRDEARFNFFRREIN